MIKRPSPFEVPLLTTGALALALSLAACGKFESKAGGEAALASKVATSTQGSTLSDTTTLPEPPQIPEPPLPPRANPKPAGFKTLTDVMNMYTNVERPTLAVTALNGCTTFSQMKSQLVYDDIDTVPLVPDATFTNVAGDVVVQNANVVDVTNIDGAVTVERAELVDTMNNVGSKHYQAHDWTARLVNSLLNIVGIPQINTLALLDAINLHDSAFITAHAVGSISLTETNELDAPTLKRACIQAQDIGTVTHFLGDVVLVGRGEGGDSGNIDTLSHLNGNLFVFEMDVANVQNLTLIKGRLAYFENSYVHEIQGSLAGTIHLKGSKVDSITNSAASPVMVYLQDGSEVAEINGAVTVMKVN